MRPPTLRTLILGIPAAVGIFVLISLGDREQEDHRHGAPVTPAGTGETDTKETQAPQVVRITLTPSGSSHDDRNDPASESPRILGEFRHAGELDEASKEGAIRNLVFLLKRDQEKLERMETSGGLEEAELLWSLALKNHAIQALESRSYIATRDGEPAPGSIIPGAETLVTGGEVNGDNVQVTIVLPYASYPDLQAARDYMNVVRDVENWKVAESFNSLPEADRRLALIKIARLLEKPHRSSEELSYIYKTIGKGAKIDLSTNRVSIEKVR